jgi:hypothetical protein
MTHQCLVCEKELEWLEYCFREDATNIEVVCGFGSRLDGDVYSGALCDDCIKDKYHKGVIKFEKRLFQ